jgi:fructokinase
VSGAALVVGEALIDVVQRADGTTDAHPGGSPANVAITLGRLGRGVGLLTWIGDDAYGMRIRSWLGASGVELVAGSDGALATSVATAKLAADGSATYDFDLVWDLPAATEPTDALVVHTGSIAAVLTPGESGVRAVLEAHRRTATLTYDPNLRPSLMGTPDDVRRQVEDLVASTDVVKVSDEDLAWLYPGTDPARVATRWLASGPALVVVTLGGEGAFAVAASGTAEVRAPRVQVVDTVGAGDSFMGALVDGLWAAGLLGADNRPALRAIGSEVLASVLERCAQVAAITVSRAGANPPRADELV